MIYDIAVEGIGSVSPRFYFDQFLRAFTLPVEYVQGVSAIPGYQEREVEEDIFLDPNNYTRVGSYTRKSKKIFISSQPLDGYPDPCPLEINKKDIFEHYSVELK